MSESIENAINTMMLYNDNGKVIVTEKDLRLFALTVQEAVWWEIQQMSANKHNECTRESHRLWVANEDMK